MFDKYPFHDMLSEKLSKAEIDAFNLERFRFSQSDFILQPQEQRKLDAAREASLKLLEAAMRMPHATVADAKDALMKEAGSFRSIW